MRRWASTRSQTAIGALTLATLALITAWVFGGSTFLRSDFEVQGVVATANQVHVGSPVRLGGVDIGRVRAIEPGPGATSLLSLTITRNAKKLRADASFTVLPRLVLEGSAYIAMSPGTPTAPAMGTGATIPIQRTSVAVQLDQALGVFTSDVRSSLRHSIKELGDGLGPTDHGPGSGSRGLRDASRELDAALGSITRTAAAVQGTRPGDLRHALGGTAQITRQLARNPDALADIVTNTNRVFTTLSDRSASIASTIREADALLGSAPAKLREIRAALPPLRVLARALRPTLAAAPHTLRSANRALIQLNGLVGRAELPLALRRLRPLSLHLPALVDRLRATAAELLDTSQCLGQVAVPMLESQVPDGRFTTGDPLWVETMHAGAALASYSNSFDANGVAVRVAPSVSETSLVAQLPAGDKLYGRGELSGVAPLRLPAGLLSIQWRPDARCADQQPANLGARRGNRPQGFEAGKVRALTSAERKVRQGLLAEDKSIVLQALASLFPKQARSRPSLPQKPKAPRPPKPVLPDSPSRPSTGRRPSLPVTPSKAVKDVTDRVLDIVGGLLKPNGGGR